MDGSVRIKLAFELVGLVMQVLADDVEDSYFAPEAGRFVQGSTSG